MVVLRGHIRWQIRLGRRDLAQTAGQLIAGDRGWEDRLHPHGSAIRQTRSGRKFHEAAFNCSNVAHELLKFRGQPYRIVFRAASSRRAACQCRPHVDGACAQRETAFTVARTG